MRPDPFVHLHVASGYSMQYGANHPADLVERAAEHGMRTLALTDRDGLYGAVKFALACRAADVRPLFGVDPAVVPTVDSTVPRALAPVVGEEHSPGLTRSRRPSPPWSAVRTRRSGPGLAGRGRRTTHPAAPDAARRPAAGRASTRGCRGSPSWPGTARGGGRCAG